MTAIRAVEAFWISIISLFSFSSVVVVAIVLSAVIFILYKINYKTEARQEGITSPLPSSAVNVKRTADAQQQQLHSEESSDLGMVPIRAITTPNPIQTIGIAERGIIVEMDAGLSSNQALVPTLIYTNLALNQIAYIKSFCHESHQIGEGSFARVYRGGIQGNDLAIKEIEHRSPDTKTWVQNEVELLHGKDHININKLYAWCIEANISYLAYIYIDGCSLDDYLRGNCIGFSYSRKQSFRMIVGIAKGIQFLHLNKIIHVDIKPQNIMVDANENEAKLVDFGFSRHVDWEGTHRSTDKIIGTKGYWAPEYCWNNKLSYKHDVYSFGIVVLEVITGQRHVDQARGSSQFHIPGYVRHMIENNRFEQAVDAKLKQDGWDIFALEEALSVANIALRCAHPDKVERPDMNLVLTELSSMMSSAQSSPQFGIEQKEEEISIATSM
ncbi:hypothetical protein SUGI_0859410 [Cryptomeria japonica]|nr:hypothetical protein SUGI_0859410 [Cryptomeria japonica]